MKIYEMNRAEVCECEDYYATIVPQRRRKCETVNADKKTALKKCAVSVMLIAVVVVCNLIIHTM